MKTEAKEKRFHFCVCHSTSHGGYWGNGHTEEEAISACKLACKDAGDLWANYRKRQVMSDRLTGNVLWQKGN